MPMRLRTKTTRPAAGPGSRSAACAAGLLLAGVARSFEDADVAEAGGLRGARTSTPAEARLKDDVAYLAADAREGRGPGTKGIEAAADYIADRLQGGRAQAGPRGRRLFPAVLDSAALPASGNAQELAFRRPGRTGGSKASSGDDFTPLAIGIGGKLEGVADRLRRLRHHGQGRRAQARLRRLRRHRRQGKGRPDHPPRAAAGRRSQPVRRQAVPADSRPSSTRRPMRFSTARRRSSWSTTGPASRTRRTSCCSSTDARHRADLEASRS